MSDDKIIDDFKKKELEAKIAAEAVAKVEAEKKKLSPMGHPVVEEDIPKQAVGMEANKIQLLEAREKRVKEMEDRIDSKISEYKKLISEAEKHGESLAGDAIVRDKTKEEEITANAKKMLAGTGMEDRI